MTNFIKIIIFFLFFISKSSYAQKINLVRDAEIENFLYELSRPLLENIKIDSTNLKFYIDRQKYINAFVTNGPRIFLTTELLTKTSNINQVVGVIAHELGHVTGGHLNKRANAYNNSLITSVLSSILAVGAIAAGAGDAGNAIILGGQHIGNRQLLSFSRNQESFADQAAIKLLKSSGYSVNGMYELFKILEKKERISSFNPYNLTHPLSRERKRIIEFHLDNNRNHNKNYKLEKKFKLVQAKLNGFLASNESLERLYTDNNEEKWYAYAIRYHMNGNKIKALLLIDQCIDSDKKNPYFYETKGQIYYENGDAVNAIANFKKALNIKNNEKHFYLALAKALYLSDNQKNYSISINLLKNYIKLEDFPIEAWHFLALCYGKLQKYSLSSLALTEKFLLLNDLKNAKLQLKRAEQMNNDNDEVNSLILDLKFLIKQKESK